MSDEPIAVVLAGSDASGRSAVLGSLLGRTGPLLRRPPGSYVVVSYGRGRPIAPMPPAEPGAPPRPPRRLDVAVADPLLRHLSLIEAPATDHLDVAGTRVLADVAARGGAVIYSLAAGTRLPATEVTALCALVTAGVPMFFALTPDRSGRWPQPPLRGRCPRPPDPDEPEATALEAHRAHVVTAVPALADAAWHAVDPPAADTAVLRRDLLDWARTEGLRRAVDDPRCRPETIPVPRSAVGSDWRALGDRLFRVAEYQVRHHLAVELAGTHLRCLRRLDGGADSGEMLHLLDAEMHAVALRVDAESEQILALLIEEILAVVLGRRPPPDAWRTVAAAVRRQLSVTELIRALLVTADCSVVTVPGAAAVTALQACHRPEYGEVLPATALGLAAECWAVVRPGGADDAKASRSRLQRMLGEVERVLSAEVGLRFAAVHAGVRGVVADAIHAGNLPP
jgi:hypothetical protein